MTGSQAALENAFTRQAQLGKHFRSPVKLGNEWTSGKIQLIAKKRAGQCPPFLRFDDACLIQGTQSTQCLSDPHYAARNRLASMPYCLIL